MQQQKTSLLNLVVYAVSTVATSQPILPRWIQDCKGATTSPSTPKPRSESIHEVRIQIEPEPPQRQRHQQLRY